MNDSPSSIVMLFQPCGWDGCLIPLFLEHVFSCGALELTNW